jgi:ATP-binding protein involved in chromosome partitioning
MEAQVRASAAFMGQSPIEGIRNVIPVGSGKGGVGKSTVSANIAVALASMGAAVGLMDADVYGPSIPTIMGITEAPKPGKRGILPIEAHGVKVISMGFFLKPDQAVVWRGPMLTKMIDQFLGGVEWGELDYLIVDLPPGTGDIQLSLCQKIPLTGAVVVSTPQDVALLVAEKAITMFNQLKSPILGLVENMSYFVCPHCGERENIFDTGGAERASERLNLPYLGGIPLATAIRRTSDSGRPIVIDDPGSPSALAFREIAQRLAAQVSIRNLKTEENAPVRISF